VTLTGVLPISKKVSGIATFEQLVEAVSEGFNMDPTVAAGLAAFGMVISSQLADIHD
jgi:hypothetical protein